MQNFTREQHAKFYFDICDIFTKVSKEYNNDALARNIATAFDVPVTDVVIDNNDNLGITSLENTEANKRRILRIYNRFLRDRYDDTVTSVERYCRDEGLGDITPDHIARAFQMIGVKTPDESSEAELSDDSSKHLWASDDDDSSQATTDSSE